MSARRLLLLAAAGLIGYLATGLTVIQQDEVGVVRRFGAVLPDPYPPGLHWGLPWGLDRVDRVVKDQARKVTVRSRRDLRLGLRSAGRPTPTSDDFLDGRPEPRHRAGPVVQFRVLRPSDYLFRTRSADAALAALGESALARALAGRSVDDVLTTGRAEVAAQMRREIQAGSDAQGLGFSVGEVRLAQVAPPGLVAPAFADVARARSDRRQAVTRAEEYRDRARADAKGLARETADRAAARYDALVQSARGEADRFAKIVAAVRKDPQAARHRMYLETVAELLPRFTRKVVVEPKQDVDLSVIADQ